MDRRTKTFEEFAERAAEMIQQMICQMRVLRIKNPDAVDPLSAKGLAILEKEAGSHARQRTPECGDCIGCRVPARPAGALLH